jgi:hypothetical protein
MIKTTIRILLLGMTAVTFCLYPGWSLAVSNPDTDLAEAERALAESEEIYNEAVRDGAPKEELGFLWEAYQERAAAYHRLHGEDRSGS